MNLHFKLNNTLTNLMQYKFKYNEFKGKYNIWNNTHAVKLIKMLIQINIRQKMDLNKHILHCHLN